MNDPTPVPHTAWTPDGEAAPKPTEDALIAAIGNVYDPEIPVNVYELGLIYTIDIGDDGRVKVEMTLDRAGLPQRAGTAGAGAGGCDVGPRRHRLRGRDGVGPAMGPEPHDRGSPVAAEYVLMSPYRSHLAPNDQPTCEPARRNRP